MKRLVTLSLVFLVSTCLLFAVEKEKVKAAEAKPIKIGAPLPITGWFATDGLNMKDGITLALEDINSKGGLLGRSLELAVFDVEDMAPEKAIAAADTLIMRDKVSVSVTGYAGVGGDVQAFGKYDPVYLHADGSIEAVKLLKENPQFSNVFQLSSIEKDWGRLQFEILAGLPYEFPNKKLAVLVAEYDWDINVVTAAKKRAIEKGWEVVVDEVFPYGTREWTPILTKIRALDPAIIIFEDADPSDVKSFVDQFVANPSNSIVDIGYALGLPQYIEIASESHSGVFGYSTVAPLPNPEGIAWKKRFEQRFGREPGNISGTTYDGVMMWANAVKTVGDVGNHAAIGKYIATSPYKGLNGTYDYTVTDDHTVRADAKSVPMHYFQLQNGTRVLVSLGTAFRPDFEFQKPKWIKK